VIELVIVQHCSEVTRRETSLLLSTCSGPALSTIWQTVLVTDWLLILDLCDLTVAYRRNNSLRYDFSFQEINPYCRLHILRMRDL